MNAPTPGQVRAALAFYAAAGPPRNEEGAPPKSEERARENLQPKYSRTCVSCGIRFVPARPFYQKCSPCFWLDRGTNQIRLAHASLARALESQP